jgi:hypothetical protein
VLADDPQPITDRTIYGLNVSVASLKSFSEHGRKLAALGQGPAVAITRMLMLDLEYPQLEFQLIGWVDAETAPKTLKLSTDRPWKVNYGSAGLALAMGDAGPRAALPMAVPQVPDHLRQPATKPPFEDATPATTSGKSSSIDDEVAKW